MISEQEALERLVAFHDHIAAAPVPPEDDVRRGRSRIRRTRGLVAGGTALGVAALVAALWWGGAGGESDRTLPAEPSPSPTTSATASTVVSMAPLRRDGRQVVAVMTPAPLPEGEAPAWRSSDPQGDAERGAVDIVEVVVQNFGGQDRLDWMFRVREDYPVAVDPGRRIEYGIVLDTDGDRTADCQIGVSRDVGGTDQPFTSWVTNLRTGVTEREDGPPYGRLIDFRHPAEIPSGPADTREMRFFFNFADTGPCEGYGARSTFYSWAAYGDGGRASMVDHAPDTAWLRMPGG